MAGERGSLEAVLRALWRERIHVEPRLLEALPPNAARMLEHVWEPAEILLADLKHFPLGLLQFWQESGRGHVVFAAEGPFTYRPGAQTWQARRDIPTFQWEGGVFLPAAAVKTGARPSIWMPLLRFWDHLLGGHAEEGGGWFSAGCGANAPLSHAAERFVELEALHYGHEALGAESPGDYFAHTFWLRGVDRAHLNVLDPLLCKLYDVTLFAPAFWRRALGHKARATRS